MITVKFELKGSDLTGFSVKGHAFFDEIGKDIICAAVSSAVYMAVNTLSDVFEEKLRCKVDEGFMELALEDGYSDNSVKVLKGLELHLKQLSEEYPENVKVIYHGGVK